MAAAPSRANTSRFAVTIESNLPLRMVVGM
jgi:hypothetical protein